MQTHFPRGACAQLNLLSKKLKSNWVDFQWYSTKHDVLDPYAISWSRILANFISYVFVILSSRRFKRKFTGRLLPAWKTFKNILCLKIYRTMGPVSREYWKNVSLILLRNLQSIVWSCDHSGLATRSVSPESSQKALQVVIFAGLVLRTRVRHALLIYHTMWTTLEFGMGSQDRS